MSGAHVQGLTDGLSYREDLPSSSSLPMRETSRWSIIVFRFEDTFAQYEAEFRASACSTLFSSWLTNNAVGRQNGINKVGSVPTQAWTRAHRNSLGAMTYAAASKSNG